MDISLRPCAKFNQGRFHVTGSTPGEALIVYTLDRRSNYVLDLSGFALGEAEASAMEYYESIGHLYYSCLAPLLMCWLRHTVCQ